MTSRILPREEWARLDGVDLGQVLPLANPETVSVIVVEDAGEIVGCWAAFTILHAEGVWVHPDHRGKSSVARRLWAQMGRLVRGSGARSVMTGAATPDIAALLEKHGGAPLPYQSYVLSMEQSCRSES